MSISDIKNKMNFQNDDYNEYPSLYIGSEFLLMQVLSSTLMGVQMRKLRLDSMRVPSYYPNFSLMRVLL